MSERLAQIEVADGLGRLWLAAPPRNTLDRRLFDDLHEAVEEIAGLALRGLVVRGRGRHFSAGADVDELRRMAADPGFLDELLRSGETLLRLESLPFPVIAAVDGACLGVGLELALACHHRVATPSAVLGLPESTFGLLPGCGGTVRLRERVGLGRAVELLLSGRLLDAEEAREVGLVDAVVPRAALDDAAGRLIRALPVPRTSG